MYTVRISNSYFKPLQFTTIYKFNIFYGEDHMITFYVDVILLQIWYIYIYIYKRNETKNYPTRRFMQRVQSSGV